MHNVGLHIFIQLFIYEPAESLPSVCLKCVRGVLDGRLRIQVMSLGLVNAVYLSCAINLSVKKINNLS